MTRVLATPPRVIVADDHPGMRDRVVSLLAPAFDVVAAVGDGQQAVEATIALQPDAVVLDVMMPTLDGVQAAIRIRGQAQPPRVLLITAMGDHGLADATRSLGVSGLIPKHEMGDDLVPVLHRALRTPFAHGVYIHQDLHALGRVVGKFLGGGLAEGQPALIVARPSQQAAILDHLVAAGVDCRARTDTGDIVLIDVDEVVERLSVAGASIDQVLRQMVLPDIERLLQRSESSPPRLYGEIAPRLQERGRLREALDVERAWNQSSVARRCSTLCGYAQGITGRDFKPICEQHSDVVTAASVG